MTFTKVCACVEMTFTARRRLARVCARDVLQPSRRPASSPWRRSRAWLSRNAPARFRASEAHKARLRAQVAQGMSRALLLQVETPLQVWDKSRVQVAVRGSLAVGAVWVILKYGINAVS